MASEHGFGAPSKRRRERPGHLAAGASKHAREAAYLPWALERSLSERRPVWPEWPAPRSPGRSPRRASDLRSRSRGSPAKRPAAAPGFLLLLPPQPRSLLSSSSREPAGFLTTGPLCHSPFQPASPFPKSKSSSWFLSTSPLLGLHLPVIHAPKCTLHVPLLRHRNPKQRGQTLEGDPLVRSLGRCVESSPHAGGVCCRLTDEHDTSPLKESQRVCK